MKEPPRTRSERAADILARMKSGELDTQAGCDALRQVMEEASRYYFARLGQT